MECKNKKKCRIRVENKYFGWMNVEFKPCVKPDAGQPAGICLVLHKAKYTLVTAEWLLASSLTNVFSSRRGLSFPTLHTRTTISARNALASKPILALFKSLWMNTVCNRIGHPWPLLSWQPLNVEDELEQRRVSDRHSSHKYEYSSSTCLIQARFPWQFCNDRSS